MLEKMLELNASMTAEANLRMQKVDGKDNEVNEVKQSVIFNNIVRA